MYIMLEDYLLIFGKRNMNNDKFWMMIHGVKNVSRIRRALMYGFTKISQIDVLSQSI